MCRSWSVSFQKGMHFHLSPDLSVLLMSCRHGAPYRDRIEETGRILTYEGHDISRSHGGPEPKSTDQPGATSGGRLTQNGLFEQAALNAKKAKQSTEIVAVYEKIHAGIWAFNGISRLTNCWREQDGTRSVFKFQLELAEDLDIEAAPLESLPHTRMIPSAVKLEVCSVTKDSAFFAERRIISTSTMIFLIPKVALP